MSMRRTTIVMATAGAMVLAVAGPALAKGSNWSVLVTTGTGRSARTLSVVGDVWEQDAGLFDVELKQPGAPALKLGPGYPVTITGPCDGGGTFSLRQTVYPYPALGPWTYTAPNQPYCESGVTPPGGWFAAPTSLFSAMTAAGLPARPPEIAHPAAVPVHDDHPMWPIALSAVALFAASLAGFALAARRLRRRAAVPAA
jgi:hypothetical protein